MMCVQALVDVNILTDATASVELVQIACFIMPVCNHNTIKVSRAMFIYTS